jgi:hypothetical protein
MAYVQQITTEDRDFPLQMLATQHEGFVEVASTRLMNWHTETLPPETKKALDFLSTEAWLEESNWYLASWQEIRRFFRKEISRIARELVMQEG